jgi:hypothetical protein
MSPPEEHSRTWGRVLPSVARNATGKWWGRWRTRAGWGLGAPNSLWTGPRMGSIGRNGGVEGRPSGRKGTPGTTTGLEAEAEARGRTVRDCSEIGRGNTRGCQAAGVAKVPDLATPAGRIQERTGRAEADPRVTGDRRGSGPPRDPVQDVGVDLGGADAAVAQQFLDRADVVARLQQVGREGMAKGVARGPLGQTRHADSHRHGTLHQGGSLWCLPSSPVSRFRHRDPGGTPTATASPSRPGVLPVDGVGQSDPSETFQKVPLMKFPNPFQVLPQGFLQATRQHGEAVLPPLAVPDLDLVPVEVDVLHPQPDALLEPQARPVHQARHQPAVALEMSQHQPHLVPGHHHRQPDRLASPCDLPQVPEVDSQHPPVQEQDRAQGLVLGGSGNPLPGRQEGQEGQESRARPSGQDDAPVEVQGTAPDPVTCRSLRLRGLVVVEASGVLRRNVGPSSRPYGCRTRFGAPGRGRGSPSAPALQWMCGLSEPPKPPVRSLPSGESNRRPGVSPFPPSIPHGFARSRRLPPPSQPVAVDIDVPFPHAE